VTVRKAPNIQHIPDKCPVTAVTVRYGLGLLITIVEALYMVQLGVVDPVF